MRRHHGTKDDAIRARRGIALLEVILAGVILGIGLSVVMSLASRSMTTQTNGEKQLVASWLVDELLSMVVVEGPDNYPRLYDTSGRFGSPFEEFSYELVLEPQETFQPYRVTASVRWFQGQLLRDVTTQTLVAMREEDMSATREPAKPVDRMERWFGEEEEESSETQAPSTGNAS